MDYSVNMNGIDVDAHYSEQALSEIFLPLLERLTRIQKEKNRRILVFLAAPPGAGKSTLASFLEKLSQERENLAQVQAIGMDGFHRRQEYLISHTTVRDGKEIRMVDIKGAPQTFDLDQFKDRIEQVLSGGSIPWPTYDRHLHNPIDNAIQVNKDIVLLEGNYLLLDEDGWRDLNGFCDYSIFISADEEMLRDRLVDRKVKSGNDKDKAESFVDYSDMANVKLCLEHSMKADLQLRIDVAGDYHEEKT
jgi:pantothenate kinase